MPDDLVTSLRKLAKYEHDDHTLAADAADEIERLLDVMEQHQVGGCRASEAGVENALRFHGRNVGASPTRAHLDVIGRLTTNATRREGVMQRQLDALRKAERERDDLRVQVEARSSWPAPEASEIVGEMRGRARVGREIVTLAKGLMDVSGAGVLPFCLSDIGSRLEAGLSVEDWSPVVDADATERGEHEEAPDAG